MKASDKDVLDRATVLARQIIKAVVEDGDAPEVAIVLLRLAVDTAERALLFSSMAAAESEADRFEVGRWQAELEERTKRLIEQNKRDHDFTVGVLEGDSRPRITS